MNTVIARVIKVLTGKSPTSRVELRDELGNEHKLELPTKAITDVTPGRVLILQWSVHDVPAYEEKPGEPPQPQPKPQGEPPPPKPEPLPDRVAEDLAGADNQSNESFFRMIGLTKS